MNRNEIGVILCDLCQGYPIYEFGDLIHCPACALTYARERETTVHYDERYVAERYDRYPTTEAMSALRLRVLEGNLYLQETLEAGHRFGVKKGALLDVGFGNGSFIRHCLREKWDAYGCDVNLAEYPQVRRVDLVEATGEADRWRVVTFFDSLEHFERLGGLVQEFARCAGWLLISVPLPPSSFPRDLAWKHYRPGEHHWYFHEPRTFERIFPGTRVAYVGTPEDSIRGVLPDGSPNIQTVLLRCQPPRREERA